jgi:hypothetical protein
MQLDIVSVFLLKSVETTALDSRFIKNAPSEKLNDHNWIESTGD